MYPLKEATSSITINKSEFIAYIKHVTSEEEYKNYLSLIRKKHYDATHVCSALILKDIKRSSDDGEPSSTAGRPILNVLENNDIDNCCALVVRYYGGIKLGTGGLVRAYSDATIEAIKKCQMVKDVIYPSYKLVLSYDLANKIDYFINNQTLLLNKEYEENVTFIFCLNDSDKLKKIVELTKGIEPIYLKDETVQEMVK